jgi:hypothetical protein
MPQEEAIWYYQHPGSEAKGPFALKELLDFCDAGEISAETLTRYGNYAVWRRFKDQPEYERAKLKADFRSVASISGSIESKRQNRLMSAIKWLYGLGYVAVGTFLYWLFLSSRAPGQGFELDWMIHLIRQWIGHAN